MSTTPHSGSDRDIQRELERTKDEASRLASDATETAKERGRETADRAKDRAADRADEVASALESTAEDLETSGDPLAGYGRSMAELMRRFAGGLREHEIEEFAGQLAGFARRNPASFFAGSVALGFGVSRFLKATSARPIEDYGDDLDDDDEYWLETEDDEDLLAGDGAVSDVAPGVSTGAASDEGWPEDAGREKPGADSVSEHASPSVTDPYASGTPEASAATPPPAASEMRTEGARAPGQEDRRNEP